MSRKTRNVPDTRSAPDKALEVLKENHDLLTGRSQSPIAVLESAATTAQIIAKINEIIGRIQQ